MKRKKRGLSLLLCATILFSCICLPSSGAGVLREEKVSKYKKVAYLTAWNMQENIAAEKLTHINYAFGFVDSDGSVKVEQESNLIKLVSLKAKNPDLKVLLSLQQSQHGVFCTMAQDSSSRKQFIAECIDLVNKYGLDGLDIDWEYPGLNVVTGEITCSNCKNDFTQLLAETREQLGDNKLLTIACGASQYLQQYTDFAAIDRYLDFYNVMTYDFQVGNISGHQSNLFAPSAGTEGWGLTGDAAIQLLLGKGVAPEKLNLGVPFYNRTSTGGEYAYPQIQKFLDSGYEYAFDETAQQSYLIDTDGNFAVAFDDVKTLQCKAAYVKEHELGGIMCWEYGQDDKENTLTNAIWEALEPAKEPEEPVNPLSIEIVGQESVKTGEQCTFTCTAFGGADNNYCYNVYVLKDGEVIYKNVGSGLDTFSFVGRAEPGLYKIFVHCTDGEGNYDTAEKYIKQVSFSTFYVDYPPDYENRGELSNIGENDEESQTTQPDTTATEPETTESTTTTEPETTASTTTTEPETTASATTTEPETTVSATTTEPETTANTTVTEPETTANATTTEPETTVPPEIPEIYENLGDNIGKIPVLECFVNDGRRKPIIVYQHGLGGKKEDVKPELEKLALAGFHAVCIDAYGHGERENVQRISAMHVTKRTTVDIDTVLDFYNENRTEDVNTGRFGIAGVSMGGAMAFYQAGFARWKPSVMVSVAGMPDWENSKFTKLLPVGTPDELPWSDIPEFNAFCSRNSPIKLLDNPNNPFMNMRILLLHGDNDGIVSVNTVKNFTNKFNALATSETKGFVDLVTYPGLIHGVIPEEINQMVIFFQNNLVGDDSPSNLWVQKYQQAPKSTACAPVQSQN